MVYSTSQKEDACESVYWQRPVIMSTPSHPRQRFWARSNVSNSHSSDESSEGFHVMITQDKEHLLGEIRMIVSRRFDVNDSVCEDLRLPAAL